MANAALQNTYRVPAGYFEGLADQVLQRIRVIEAGEAGDISSVLNNISNKSSFTVPAGYFEGLADQVLNRVKLLDMESASEELSHLSPLLAGISKVMPNAVPAGYFDNIAEIATALVKNDDKVPAEELAMLSPLLSGLKKETLYTVPAGYFEGLNEKAAMEVVKPKAKVVSITKQKWFRYAAAAVVTGFIAISGFLIIDRNTSSGDPNPEAIVKKMMKNVSPEEIDQFVKTVDEGSPVIASADIKKEADEIKELIKDIPEEEIQKFLDETPAGAAEDNSEDIFLN